MDPDPDRSNPPPIVCKNSKTGRMLLIVGSMEPLYEAEFQVNKEKVRSE